LQGRKLRAEDIQLVVFDMEGTLTADPTVWELMHLKVGTWESHGLRYWEEFKAGRIGYDDFARLDVRTWQGAPSEWLDAATNEVPLMPGCEALLTSLLAREIQVGIISNGLERLGRRLARQFGFEEVLANREVVRDGCLTGDLDIVVPYDGKGEALERVAADLNIPMNRVMAVGDGPADREMFRRAGIGVAFAPSHPEVSSGADHVICERDLRRLLALFNGGDGA